MTIYTVYNAAVRATGTGELRTDLLGQQVAIVTRGTTTPFPIQASTGDPISGSLVTVQSSFCVETFDIDVTDPSELYLDWLDPVSGDRGGVDFDAVLRDAAMTAAADATASNIAAQGALAAAQALDSTRMQLAGAAVAQGMSCYGVWTAGAAPTPPNDGKIYWGLEIVP